MTCFEILKELMIEDGSITLDEINAIQKELLEINPRFKELLSTLTQEAPEAMVDALKAVLRPTVLQIASKYNLGPFTQDISFTIH